MNLKTKISSLPDRPGCYIMKDKYDNIIYIGKAKNLSNRVKSYFNKPHFNKTRSLVASINDFDFIICNSEKEALILEINLIKKYLPKYNIKLIDDTRYPYICITNEKYPRLLHTKDLNLKGKYFGPYPLGFSINNIIELLNKTYPLRKCNKLPNKICLYKHLDQCLAPCVSKDIKTEYDNVVFNLTTLLKNDMKSISKYFKKEMNEASIKLEFEEANKYKQILREIDSFSSKQIIEYKDISADVFSYYSMDEYMLISILIIRKGSIIGYNSYFLEIINEASDLFVETIEQYYHILKHQLPNEIIIPSECLSYFENSSFNNIKSYIKGHKKELLDLSYKNAVENYEIKIKEQEIKNQKINKIYSELKDILKIDKLDRIEAYDISHISGVDQVAGVIVIENGDFLKKEYRRYKIKTLNKADDLKALSEVLFRRNDKLLTSNLLPDLIIIDGGFLQVKTAISVLESMFINLPILGLKKNDEHKTESLIYNNEEIYISKKSSLFYFLENIQDEVHRFAISYFKSLHTNNSLSTHLKQIKGIGKVKEKEILKIFQKENPLEELEKLKFSEDIKIQIRKIIK